MAGADVDVATPLTGPAPPEDQGLTWDGTGCDAVVWAPHAARVEVCLFDGPVGPGEHQVALTGDGRGAWRGRLDGIGPGQRYGLRVDGPYDPARGLRHNPAKLLLDPYAQQVEGTVHLDPALAGWAGDPYGPERDHRDSARVVPRGVVVAPGPPPEPVATSRGWSDSVVYEAHVRGLTARHPDVPAHLRGTYAGLASPAVVDHLTGLGVTTVELLPVHAFVSEGAVQAHGLTNYWGYNSLGFCAPHPGYAATDDPVTEFRAMVGALHAAGLEVLLDVVYNHTAEGGAGGPTLSLRGLDNAGYYRLEGGGAHYADRTGCGNTVELAAAPALGLVLTSMRHWVRAMGVDGFRFDLASTLVHGTGFLDAVAADPLLRRVRLVAEPWDLASYDVGGFPAPWAEWNGRYRDDVRDAWHGRADSLGGLARRLSGSSDLYAGRSPQASVSFVTAHDGFPLTDLVSYTRKRNDANGEHGRDGSDDNRSTNAGIEGPTDDAAVLDRRRRLRRAHLATLLLSAGVPMLLAGDELGHTQHGNNNVYCQDNDLAHLAWPHDPDDPAGPDPLLVPLVRGLTALRARIAALHRPDFFTGGPSAEGDLADLTWFDREGAPMTDPAWAEARVLQVHLRGAGPGPEDGHLLVVNPSPGDVTVTLPGRPWAAGWELLLDTAADDLAGFANDRAARLPVRDEADPTPSTPAGAATAPALSVLVLRST